MNRRNIEVTNPNADAHRRELSRAVNLLNLTLRLRGSMVISTPSVTIEDDNIGEDAVAMFVPADLNAAASHFYVEVSNKKVEFFLTSGVGGKYNYLIIL